MLKQSKSQTANGKRKIKPEPLKNVLDRYKRISVYEKQLEKKQENQNLYPSTEEQLLKMAQMDSINQDTFENYSINKSSQSIG